MKIKKFNAGLSLVTTFLILCHAIALAAWMLSMGRIMPKATQLPWVLTWITGIHAVISIFIMASELRNKKKNKSVEYPKDSVSTIVQRLSGMLMLIFTALHILGASGIMQPPQIVHAIVPPLFFTLVMVHVAVSTEKAFVTLEIGSEKFVKAVNVFAKMLCGATLIADIIGFYLYVC